MCLGSPPPLHCQVFTMATSFQTRGTEHISIWCWGAREAQREWEWGPATPPLTGQGPGLALTQAYSRFPCPALNELSTRIWTHEGHHKDEGKESGHMEPGLLEQCGPTGGSRAGGWSWCSYCASLQRPPDLFYEGATALSSTGPRSASNQVISLP